MVRLIVQVAIPPMQINIEDKNGKYICSRTQVPLVLAYALTAHRAQGLTLKSVILHLQQLFAHWHLYTGLSRVSDFEFLRATGPLDQCMLCCAEEVQLGFTSVMVLMTQSLCLLSIADWRQQMFF